MLKSIDDMKTEAAQVIGSGLSAPHLSLSTLKADIENGFHMQKVDVYGMAQVVLSLIEHVEIMQVQAGELIKMSFCEIGSGLPPEELEVIISDAKGSSKKACLVIVEDEESYWEETGVVGSRINLTEWPYWIVIPGSM